MSMAGVECWNCAGSGAIPSQGGEPPEDVDNGYTVCPTCAGSGRLGSPWRRTAAEGFVYKDADTPDDEWGEPCMS